MRGQQVDDKLRRTTQAYTLRGACPPSLACLNGMLRFSASSWPTCVTSFKETVQPASGKYALIENSREFTLVPWRPVIERQLGREVAGLVRGNDISWEFGRKRSLGISM